MAFLAVIRVVNQLSNAMIIAPILMIDNKIPYVLDFIHKVFSGQPILIINIFNFSCIPALERSAFDGSNSIDVTRVVLVIEKNAASKMLFAFYLDNMHLLSSLLYH